MFGFADLFIILAVGFNFGMQYCDCFGFSILLDVIMAAVIIVCLIYNSVRLYKEIKGDGNK